MQSWDAFEQMQRPQQPTSQPTHVPDAIIEPGSQPLPAGTPMQPMQGLAGLPPRGRAERRLSGAAAADGHPQLRRDSGPAADGSPLQQLTAGQIPAAAVRPVVVSSVSNELLNQWFAEADEDLDGRQALCPIAWHMLKAQTGETPQMSRRGLEPPTQDSSVPCPNRLNYLKPLPLFCMEQKTHRPISHIYIISRHATHYPARAGVFSCSRSAEGQGPISLHKIEDTS